MMDHAALRLRLIGPMQALTANSVNVLPPGRKTRALLACIAIAMPRSVLRRRLTQQLCCRRPEQQARASLRQEIHRLQDALSPVEPNVLIVTRDDLALRPGVVSTDVREVTEASPEQPAALSLVTADLLAGLEGIDPNFDAWLQAERNQLRNRALRIAESVLREVISPDDAIEAAERILAIDRTHEGAWRTLMNIHDARGERGLAMQAYKRCCAALTEAADAVPSAATQMLSDAIRASSHEPHHSANALAFTAAPPERLQGSQNEPASYDSATKTTRGTRIGVMPFRLVGSSDEHACLAPGLADEITSALARSHGVAVVSPDSLSRFAAENRNEALIRQQLRLDFLLDGSVQRGGSKIRSSLQLLDLRANNQIVWAHRFDRDDNDLLLLQDEIAAEVAAQIDPAILSIEARRGAGHGPADATAHDLLLRAIPWIGRMEQESFMQAGRYLADGIALEPGYARLYIWYAHWHILLVEQGWAENPSAISGRAGELAERAIDLEPLDARGLAVGGHVRAFLYRRLPDAMVLHDRALSLNPNLAMAWALSGVAHAYAGNLEEAERRTNRYKALSPYHPHAFYFDFFLVLIHLLKRDYEIAVELGRAAVQLNPSFSASYKPYLAALGCLRCDHEAAAVRGRLQAIEPGFTVERFLENNPIERDCDRMHYAEGLRLAGIATNLP